MRYVALSGFVLFSMGLLVTSGCRPGPPPPPPRPYYPPPPPPRPYYPPPPPPAMRDFTPPTVAMNAAVFADYQRAIEA